MNRPLRANLLPFAAFLALSCATQRPAAKLFPVAAPPPPATPTTTQLESAPVDLGEAALAPITLASADGVSLPLLEMEARATLSDPLATTELHLTFQNVESSALEARLTIALAPGAAVRRVAIRKPTPAAASALERPADAWEEAALVERGHLRATYDELLAARTRPELFTEGAGLPFVFGMAPIDPGGKVEVIVAYDETLSQSAYRLRVRGIPKLASFKARIDLAGAAAPLGEVDLRDQAPTGDLVIPESRYHTTSGTGQSGVSGDGVIAVRVPIAGPSSPDALLSPIFLFDTSASRTLDSARQVSVLEDLTHRLPPNTEVAILAFDQTVVPIYQGRAGDLDSKVFATLRARRGLGASDLGSALGFAGRLALANTGLHHRLVVFTDGALTAGERNPLEIARMAKELGAQGIDRTDVIAAPGMRDDAVLDALTHNPDLPWRGVVVDIARGPDEIQRRLTQSVLPSMAVAVDSATFVWPRRIDGAQAGDEALVLAEVASGSPLVRVGGASTRPVMAKGPQGLVERRVASARIESLLDQRELAVADRRAAIALVSQKRGVPSPFTTFSFRAPGSQSGPLARAVVLSEAFRWNDVDIVDALPTPSDSSDVMDPLDASLRITPHPQAIPSKEAKGAARKAEPAPEKPPPAPVDEPTGRIPEEVIQRIVRLNHGRFRACYQRAIAQRPKLAGRVVVSFVIDSSGAVPHAEDGGSDVDSATLRECVQKAFLALSFPAPPGGQVVVKYPIVFAVDDRPPPPTHAVAVKYAAPPVPSQEPEPHFDSPYVGPYRAVMAKIFARDTEGALLDARKWQARAPDDILGYLALGEAAEAKGDQELAARAYGSILELWSYRADLSRTAGERLGHLGTDGALRTARDAFALARDERPEHPTGHRLLAFAEYRMGRPEEAFRVLERALNDNYQSDRFVGARVALGEDLGLLAAAWIRSAPERRGEIERRTKTAGGKLQGEPSMRASLFWETNTTDVDLHVGDSSGDHVSRKRRALSGGGELSTDIVDGYGPELFSVTGPIAKRNYPFSIAIAFPARGPLGFATGTVEVVEHDGKGHLHFDDRPFVVMNGQAGIELGDIVSPSQP